MSDFLIKYIWHKGGQSIMPQNLRAQLHLYINTIYRICKQTLTGIRWCASLIESFQSDDFQEIFFFSLRNASVHRSNLLSFAVSWSCLTRCTWSGTTWPEISTSTGQEQSLDFNYSLLFTCVKGNRIFFCIAESFTRPKKCNYKCT